uniref:Collectin-12 n=1 Tax=Magallana gigas TaxID=29159 RepID=K1QAD0_MAGGI
MSVLNQFQGLEVFWIGLTEQETEGMWRWSHSQSAPQNPQWLDGRPDGGTAENCAMLHSGRWDDFSCHDTMYFICEK